MRCKIINYMAIFYAFICSNIAFGDDKNEFNFEFTFDNNIQSEYYNYGYTMRGLWHIDKFSLGAGVKSFTDYQDSNKNRLDIVGLVDLYQDEKVNISLGSGFEGRSPKIEYAIGYHFSPSVSIKAGLRQVLSRDFDENYTDFSLGVVYTYKNKSQGIEKLLLPDLVDNTLPERDVIELSKLSPLGQNQIQDDTDQGFESEDIVNGDNKIYVVVKGDYLYKIARRFDTTVKHLLKMNVIKNPDLIYPDQIINL